METELPADQDQPETPISNLIFKTRKCIDLGQLQNKFQIIPLKSEQCKINNSQSQSKKYRDNG